MIPTAYGRDGDRLLLHGAAANHVLKAAAAGAELTVTVTLVDGLVLARSTFHHSINYRSVVVFGRATRIEDPVEQGGCPGPDRGPHRCPGGPATPGGPTPTELASTRVLSLPLDEVSAKVRTGGPIDDDEDMELPVWAGVLPLRPAAGQPEPDGDHSTSGPRTGIPLPTRPLERWFVGPSLSPMGTYIGPGVWEIDTRLGGWSRVTAGYLIEGPAPVLVETGQPVVGAGPAGSPGRTRRRPRRSGRAWPSPTSTSTTPAVSGTWPGPSRAPPCTCTRRALAIWSIRTAWSDRPATVYGDLLDSLYGRLDPTPAERIHVLADGEAIDIGPGPHPHHRRFPRPRQASSGPPRQRERHPVRR